MGGLIIALLTSRHPSDGGSTSPASFKIFSARCQRPARPAEVDWMGRRSGEVLWCRQYYRQCAESNFKFLATCKSFTAADAFVMLFCALLCSDILRNVFYFCFYCAEVQIHILVLIHMWTMLQVNSL